VGLPVKVVVLGMGADAVVTEFGAVILVEIIVVDVVAVVEYMVDGYVLALVAFVE